MVRSEGVRILRVKYGTGLLSKVSFLPECQGSSYALIHIVLQNQSFPLDMNQFMAVYAVH